MKIYFEDGEIVLSYNLGMDHYCLDAKYGVSENKKYLKELMEKVPNAVLYTNSLIALDNQYVWNEELQVPELYIRSKKDNEFHRVDELTNKCLRKAHNLAKMYLANAFDNE